VLSLHSVRGSARGSPRSQRRAEEGKGTTGLLNAGFSAGMSVLSDMWGSGSVVGGRASVSPKSGRKKTSPKRGV
jgi:hypothetical protein